MRRRRLSGVRIAKLDLEPYGLGGEGACAPVISPSRAVHVCIKRPGKPGRSVLGPQTVCDILHETVQRDRESFYALHLDTRNRVIGIEEIAKGTPLSVEFRPADVFKSAILTNATSIVVAHNHPSGDVEPSKEDKALTSSLIEAGRLLGIPVRDHVLVGAEGCYSLREKGDVAGFKGAARFRRRR